MKREKAENKNKETINSINLLNEKGVALVMVLIIAGISLAMMAGLLYMITSGTQISGLERKYKIAREAGIGGGGIGYEVIDARITTATSLATEFNFLTNVAVTASDACLNAKLFTKTSDWALIPCNNSTTIDPLTAATYDMSFDLGGYKVYEKIVDTVAGNTSGGSERFRTAGVVAPQDGSSGLVKPLPYLYTLEIHVQSLTNPSERAKLSILYQY